MKLTSARGRATAFDRRNGKDWPGALRSAAVSGAISAAATSAYVAAAGARDTGSAVAPINATSHIAWGETAADVERTDARHTLLGLALNLGACVFLASFYERLFGRAADRGRVGTALVGGGVVAATAYVVDYHVVPKRLTPGWESRITQPSLFAAYAVLALCLPLRGLLRRR